MIMGTVIVRQFWFQMGVIISGILAFFRNTFRSINRTTEEVSREYEEVEDDYGEER